MSFFSSIVSIIPHYGTRFLTITFRISSVKCRVYFLVVCLFAFRAPALILQKNWTRNIKNKRHAPIIVVGFVLEKHFDADFTADQEKDITFKRWPPG